jgi:hypothetical protein
LHNKKIDYTSRLVIIIISDGKKIATKTECFIDVNQPAKHRLKLAEQTN